jgi:hypothetical protein
MNISIIWHTEDVLGECPWLSTEQANHVLMYMDTNHDAEFGINWETIRQTADFLHPTPQQIKDTAHYLKIIISDLYGDDDSWDIGLISQRLYNTLPKAKLAEGVQDEN